MERKAIPLKDSCMKESKLADHILSDDDDDSVLIKNIKDQYDRIVHNIHLEANESMSLDSNSTAESRAHFAPPISAPTIAVVKQKPESSNSKICILLFVSFSLTILGSYWILYLCNDVMHAKIRVNQQKFSPEHHHIPIFLDIPGLSDFNLTSILSDCAGLKSRPIDIHQDFVYQKRKEAVRFDFLTTNSLCGLRHVASRPFKVFFLIQNPMVRLLQNYVDRNDSFSPNYDKRALHLKSFDEHLNWSPSSASSDHIDNSLTRSILCRMSGKLNNDDLNTTRTFLTENAHVGNFLDHMKAISMFQHKFNWKMISSSSQSAYHCIDNQFKKVLTDEKRLLHQNVKNDLLLTVYKDHFYDFNIYLDYV